MKIVRDGKEIELTLEEIEKAYRIREMEYTVQDAKAYLERNGEVASDDFAEILAENVLDNFDCNISYWKNFDEAYEELQSDFQGL